MSLGLDALNKLQRERAERAAVGAAVVMHPAAHAKPQTNRLLAAGFVLSLAVATFALVRSRSNAVAAVPAVDAPKPVVAGQAGGVSPPPANSSAPSAVTISVPFSAPNSAESSTRPNILVSGFIASARVGGVDLRTGTGLGPVVMINDSMYHLDEMVNMAFGIRLIGINPDKLTFRDERGIVYEKQITSP